MSGDDSSLSLRAPARETVFRPFPLASSSGALYIERMFFLRPCINQSVHYLRLYRSLYSNIGNHRVHPGVPVEGASSEPAECACADLFESLPTEPAKRASTENVRAKPAQYLSGFMVGYGRK